MSFAKPKLCRSLAGCLQVSTEVNLMERRTGSNKQLLFLPGPVTVAEPVLAAMTRPLVDHRGPEFKRTLERMNSRLRPIFGTRHDILMLGASGTGGLEAAVANLFGPGEK